MSMKANTAIHCSVKNCKNHCSDQDYCSLSSIQVGTHEANPTVNECTDCLSFTMK